jgi:hypothetical protein
MLPTLSPQEFVAKWRKATLKESSAAQEHFIDLCHLVGHPTPALLLAHRPPSPLCEGAFFFRVKVRY